jgi:23S rRNA pseudouridine1911/1915/1917 synthase
MQFIVHESQDRLDLFLVGVMPEHSRRFIQRIIDDGGVCINNAVCLKLSHKLKINDIVTIVIPEIKESDTLIPEKMDLNVVFEDNDLLVIDKPSGMVVHPAAGHHDGTLVHGLLDYCGDSLSGIGGERRPGIVHRLDKETSGLMVVAKNDISHRLLSDQFSDRTLSRTYDAFVWGDALLNFAIINKPIGRHPRDRQRMAVVTNGREAITHYKIIERFVVDKKKAMLIECSLKTGRTHQIRVHMAAQKNPLMGDPLYGNKNDASPIHRQALHAKRLSFIHPTTKETMVFESSWPDDIKNLYEWLKGQ